MFWCSTVLLKYSLLMSSNDSCSKYTTWFIFVIKTVVTMIDILTSVLWMMVKIRIYQELIWKTRQNMTPRSYSVQKVYSMSLTCWFSSCQGDKNKTHFMFRDNRKHILSVQEANLIKVHRFPSLKVGGPWFISHDCCVHLSDESKRRNIKGSGEFSCCLMLHSFYI